MKKLISMTDFVIQQSKLNGYDVNDSDWIERVVKYAKFLKQPLQLGMFVLCDEMTEVMNYEEIKQSVIEGTDSWDAYQKAKEKVLFEGFVVLSNEDDIIEIECKDVFINYNKEEDLFFLDSWNGDTVIMNIECLVNLTASSIELTENAIKQIGL